MLISFAGRFLQADPEELPHARRQVEGGNVASHARPRRAGPGADPWCAKGPIRGWRWRGAGVVAEDIRAHDPPHLAPFGTQC
jgi:hypothetical protein